MSMSDQKHSGRPVSVSQRTSSRGNAALDFRQINNIPMASTGRDARHAGTHLAERNGERVSRSYSFEMQR